MRRNCLLSRVGGRVFQQGLRVLGFVLRSYDAVVTGGDGGESIWVCGGFNLLAWGASGFV